MKPGALILGGSFHSLGAARNLAKFKVSVCVIDQSNCISRFSRSVAQFLHCPSCDDEEALLEFLVGLAVEREFSGWVIFPSTDEHVRVVSQNYHLLSQHYALTIQSWDVVRHLYDKRQTHLLAEKVGIPSPQTFNPSTVNQLLQPGFCYPLVLKPAISKQFMAATKKKAYRADNQQELLENYNRMVAVIDPSLVLVQELIPGGGKNLYSFVGFFKDGIPLAGLSARRSRQHPMDFGRASTFVEVVDLPQLKVLATELLSSLNFSGLAEVEFMYDPRVSSFKLLEVNPRIWGWHTIAIHAGLNLPYLAYQYALDRDQDQDLNATAFASASAPDHIRQDVKWVRLLTDTPTVLNEIFAGRMSFREYFELMSGDIGDAVFSLSDPLPFLVDLFLAPVNYMKGRGF